MIRFDSSFAAGFLPWTGAAAFAPRLEAAHRALEEGSVRPRPSIPDGCICLQTYDGES
jgi:hypothetical protein